MAHILSSQGPKEPVQFSAEPTNSGRERPQRRLLHLPSAEVAEKWRDFPLLPPQGGLIIHVLTAVYMFMGLAIVADDYFVPALDKLAESKYGS